MSAEKTESREPYGIHILRRDTTRALEPRTGMHVGLPKVVIDASHASHALAAYDALLSRFAQLEKERETLRALLGMLYDKWENGDACYVEPDAYRDYIGNAFRLTDAEQGSILNALSANPLTSATGEK